MTQTPLGAAALSLIPADASAITVTDLDQVRAALGVPELTSESPIRERLDFWERARHESVLLAQPMVLDPGSAPKLDLGFTQDDVDWEAHFTTPVGTGWTLGFRPDLDMAVEGVDTWGTIDGITELTGASPAESIYYSAGCVPLEVALGPDADMDDLEAVVSAHDPADLAPLTGFSVSFADGLANSATRSGPVRPLRAGRNEVTATQEPSRL